MASCSPRFQLSSPETGGTLQGTVLTIVCKAAKLGIYCMGVVAMMCYSVVWAMMSCKVMKVMMN